MALCVSNAKGWKVHVAGKSAYLECFLFASADCHNVPGQWFTGLPRNESQPIWALAIGSRQAARLVAHRDTCHCQRACSAIASLMAWCLVVIIIIINIIINASYVKKCIKDQQRRAVYLWCSSSHKTQSVSTTPGCITRQADFPLQQLIRVATVLGETKSGTFQWLSRTITTFFHTYSIEVFSMWHSFYVTKSLSNTDAYYVAYNFPMTAPFIT